LKIFNIFVKKKKKKKGKENYVHSVMENIWLQQEWRRCNILDGVSNPRPLYLQSDALPFELAGPRILSADDRYMYITKTCTAQTFTTFSDILGNRVDLLIS
jgi:hypothetical protein